MTVVAFAGSLRQGSYNRRLIDISIELAPPGLRIDHLLLDGIPPYNMDLEANEPETVATLKAGIRGADGVLIAVPEHNYSYSGVLKNALDWVSRPAADNPLSGKPVILQSAAAGFAGGVRGQLHLRQVLGYFEMRQMYFPEVFVGAAHTKFTEEGKLQDDRAIEQIRKQLAAFLAFIQG